MGISLKEVSYSYNPKKKGTIYALKNVSVDIDSKDDFLAIIGETGSGKSTLCSIFNALKIPTSGVAIVNDVILRKLRKRKDNYNLIRKHVGLVFQFSDYQLFEETVLKDVMFAPLNFNKSVDEAKKIAMESLSLVHIDESYYDKSPFQLSGGEKKLVSIAGILAMEPDILIFDEPTAGIDPETKRKLIKLFKELNEIYHKTIIIIVHDMNVAYECCKRVLVLKDSELIYDSTPYDLFVNNMDIVRSANVDTPDVLRIIDEINLKTGRNLDKHIKTLNELVEVLANE